MREINHLQQPPFSLKPSKQLTSPLPAELSQGTAPTPEPWQIQAKFGC